MTTHPSLPQTLIGLKRLVRARWSAILRRCAERGAFGCLRGTLPETDGGIRILGESVKTQKGEKVGVLTRVVYLQPAAVSGLNLCPDSTPECRGACLVHHSGKAALSDSQNARAWKTALYIGDPALFRALLAAEAASHQRSAERAGMVPAIRLDGSSDIGLGAEFAGRFPGITWYDYTKSYRRAARALAAPLPNYSLCFSYSGRNLFEALAILRRGGTVSVVFQLGRGAELPETWRGFGVIDGDETDARFLDAGGVVVGLRLKGPLAAQTERAGCFAVQPEAFAV